MMPYTSSMDFSTYQHRTEFAPMISTTMGLSVGTSSSVTHSWLVPTKDSCNEIYKQPNAVMQNFNPGHVFILFLFNIDFYCYTAIDIDVNV